MTREEALEEVKFQTEKQDPGTRAREALGMAIEALTALTEVEEAMLTMRVRIAALESENSRLSKTPVLRLQAEGDTELRAVAALALNGLLAGTPDFCIGHNRERDVPHVKHIGVLADAAKVAAQELLRRLDEPKTDIGQRLEEVSEALAHQAKLATTSVDQEKWEARKEAVHEALDALERAAEEAR